MNKAILIGSQIAQVWVKYNVHEYVTICLNIAVAMVTVCLNIDATMVTVCLNIGHFDRSVVFSGLLCILHQ